MIRFFGSPMSSAGRTHLMLEEVGAPYEYVKINLREKETRSPEFVARYGAGKVPVIDDDGFVLGESMAINFYLAERYRPELMPKDVKERARVYQWSFWAITNLQPDLLEIMFAGMGMKPADAVGPEVRDRAAEQLAHLDRSLAGHQFLLGDTFTVADVNVGSVVNLAHVSGALPPDRYPNATAWLARLLERPAFQKVTAG